MTSMNTTAFRTKHAAKALSFTALALTMCSILACTSRPDHLAKSQPQSTDAITVVRISRPSYNARGEQGSGAALRSECDRWKIDRKQAATFFRLSERISSETAHRDFYYLPCSVTGELEAEGKVWNFEINAAATATWVNGDEIRSFGCSNPACKPLVVMMPDGNNE